MENNTYDQPAFFEKYKSMLRSQLGLKGAGEWSEVEKIMPDLSQKNVLDIGCGYGWHCLYAASKGARSVLGIDISEKMLEEAAKMNEYPNIEYRKVGIEEYDYPAKNYDVVICSLALHYVEDLTQVYQNIHRTLTQGGSFLFTIEHPIFTAEGTQDWIYSPSGEPIHWAVDNYFEEGERATQFLGEKVHKFHHTLTTIVNTLLQVGFEINHLIEPQPTQEMLQQIPEMAQEMRRPMMLIVSAVKR